MGTNYIGFLMLHLTPKVPIRPSFLFSLSLGVDFYIGYELVVTAQLVQWFDEMVPKITTILCYTAGRLAKISEGYMILTDLYSD